MARRVLSIALALSLAAAKGIDAEQQTEPAATIKETCIAPAQLSACEATAAQQLQEWRARLETTTSQCKQEQDAVDARLRKEQDAHREVAKQLERSKSELSALQTTIEAVERQLQDRKVELDARQSEVRAERARALELEKELKQLKKSFKESKQRNDALKLELASVDDRLTLSALLSAYYDQGVVVADQGLQAGRKALKQLQDGQVPDAVASTLEKANAVYTDVYATYLADKVDPLLETAHQKLPIAEIKVMAAEWTSTALQKSKHARATAITALASVEQIPNITEYAQPIVDVVVGMAVLLFLSLVVLPLWLWSIRTTICIATCGICCARKRAKGKRKNRATKTPPPTSTTQRKQVNVDDNSKGEKRPSTKKAVSPASGSASASQRPASAGRRSGGRKNK